jgi:RES domain-containing protein
VLFDYLRKRPPGTPAASRVQPLWPGGSSRKGARFTPQDTSSGGIACLYLATDELTPILEVSGVYRPPKSTVRIVVEPQVLMTVVGVLTNIIDVTQLKIRKALGTSHSELTGDWVVAQEDYLAKKGPMPPTQMLGQAAYDEGSILGIAYRSTKSTTSSMGIVVFTDRLAKAFSYLELHNSPTGKLKQRLP